jgi:hypothetical protein
VLKSANKILSLISGFDKIWFYCVDPGAFAVMSVLYEVAKERGEDAGWIFEGWCKENKSQMQFIELDEFVSLYEKSKCDNDCFVLGSQMRFESTHRMIQFCKDNGICSIFVFDFWGNYSKHFYDENKHKLYLPNRICVMDDVSRNSLIRELKPYIAEKSCIDDIVIIGHLGVEKSLEIIKGVSQKKKDNVRAELGAGDKKIILFLLEPVEEDFGFDSWGEPVLGYTEYSIIKHFFEKFPLDNTKVIIRPHPRQDMGQVRRRVSEFAKAGVDYVVSREPSLEESIAAADEVVGITTVGLMIALKAGKKIKSIQVGRNEKGRQLSNEFFEKNLVV